MADGTPESEEVEDSRSPLALALRSKLMAKTLLLLPEALKWDDVNDSSFNSSSNVFNPRSKPIVKKRRDVCFQVMQERRKRT